jgi:TonB family protein
LKRIAVTLLLVIAAASGQSSTRKYAAYEIASDFADNEVRGEQIFRDRVQIDGLVSRIETGTFSGAYIELAGPSSGGSITCVFEAEHIKELSPLHRGQRVILSGHSARRHLGQVFFHDCQFVSLYVPPPVSPRPTLPVAIYARDPEYTQQALVARLEGIVTLFVTVGRDGKVQQVLVEHGLGGGLDEQAARTVKTWMFKPATKDGDPVESQIRVEVSFKMPNWRTSTQIRAIPPAMMAMNPSNSLKANLGEVLLGRRKSTPKQKSINGIFRVGMGVSMPAATHIVEPQYSVEALNANLHGSCLLLVVIGADGRPRKVDVVRSLGLGLDQKAVEAVEQWTFEPATIEGNPVPVEVNVEAYFELN